MAATSHAKTTPKPAMLGRFELRRVLGQGGQATVWLGYDPRLDREVAVKLMRLGTGGNDDAATVSQWLQEARSVSRLNHPHIVPVFEADVHEQQPYLVFEYVSGCTLAEVMRARKKPLSARDATTMMLGVLDALHTAHMNGVVHRDLKPSNILVDDNGRARVMDFGIAAKTSTRARNSGGQARIVGTPGYMSPEASRGESPSPAMDVFAAGLMLAEMLFGRPLIAEKDPYRAIYRVAHEDLSLPASTGAHIDDGLRTVVLQAIARDATKRTPSAAALRDALQNWLTPVVTPEVGVPAGQSGTLEFLLRRMRHKTDFPALSDAVVRIQRVANSDTESLGSLSSEILKDVALTNKLLRLVNSAGFSHTGGGTISTVSRAVALVGFAGIRNMALSLVVLEHMQDKVHVQVLKEEFLRSLMAGVLADQICQGARESEEAFIGAMFQNLGRLLTEFYFPEEARRVRQAMSGSATEEAASIAALGLSYEELGLGVAKTWGLPDSLQRCMRQPSGEPPTKVPDNAAERVRWTTVAANEITNAMLKSDPAEADARIAEVSARYTRVLGVRAKDLQASATKARKNLHQMAQAMGLQVQAGSTAQRLLGAAVPAPIDPASDTDLSEHALHATLPADELARDTAAATAEQPDAATQAAQKREQAVNMMAAGIQDITNTMVEEFQLNAVLRMILETMLRALNFRRVLFCLRDAKTDTLTCRFGLGEGVELALPHFKIPLKGGTDLFSAVCNKGVDTLITDATVSHIASRLPTWFRQNAHAPAFLLLPLAIKGTTFALIYADKAASGEIELGEKELALLRTLRNQAVMAFKQAG